MNYDSIIIELLGRVQELEQQVQELRGQASYGAREDANLDKVTTDDILNYIIKQKERAEEYGESSIILRAGDIEKEVGLKNRITMVVNAMKKAMCQGDEVVSETASGFSTTVAIKYLLNKQGEISMKGVENLFLIKKAISQKSLHGIRELKVQAGNEYLMVFDNEHKCVGVVFEHYEKRGSTANGQAEICFFDEYFNKYGKWHRMFIGGRKGERLMFDKLEDALRKQDNYKYTGEIISK